jgi:FtsH-binding integral membrane protein
LSFWLAQKGLGNANPHAFVRSVYTSMMLKLFACIIAAFVYIAMNRDNLNKPALFTCMALYLVYTFMEVSILMKQLKGRANG